MSGYIVAALHKYQLPTTTKPQHAPHKLERPQYSQAMQYNKPPDDTCLIEPNGIKHIQKFVGTLLYYARAINSTMLMAINTVSSAQSKGTQAIAAAVS